MWLATTSTRIARSFLWAAVVKVFNSLAPPIQVLSLGEMEKERGW
jgi:hypothetical protein